MGPRQRVYPHTGEERTRERDRAVLVAADLGSTDWPVEESIAELARLTETSGAEVVAAITQRLDRPNPRTFIGSGKADEVAHLVRETGANAVVFDDDLTPSQQFNLEGLIPEVKLLDRTGLILEIFAQHATSREGKLQVELAQLEYLLPRLRGMWGHLERERLGGGRGSRFGAGESQLESDRRLARKRISDLKRELQGVVHEREIQRKGRERSGVYRVALVGYTNAGKSTLLNRLTDADALTADMLFATLDSTTRRLSLQEGREVTMTDTVGFINKLPHGLVEAFKSTLDEVREADLLLHVADGSAAQLEAQMRAVQEVLHELDAHDKPVLLVLNKADAISARDRLILEGRHPTAVFASGLTGQGVDGLLGRIGDEAARGSVTMTILVPYTRGDVVRLAHERTQLLSERHTPEGTQLVLRAPTAIVSQLEPFCVDGESEQRDTGV